MNLYPASLALHPRSQSLTTKALYLGVKF